MFGRWLVSCSYLGAWPRSRRALSSEGQPLYAAGAAVAVLSGCSLAAVHNFPYVTRS